MSPRSPQTTRLTVNRRALYRDLEVLKRWGRALYQEQERKRVTWRLDDGFKRTLSVQLSLQEAFITTPWRSSQWTNCCPRWAGRRIVWKFWV